MPDLPFDPFVVTLGGIPLIPAIIFLIQGIKSFVPAKYSLGPLWRVVALLFGAAGMVIEHLKVSGAPTEWYGWVVLIVTGLIVGVVASRAYDQSQPTGASGTLTLDATADIPEGVPIGEVADGMAAAIARYEGGRIVANVPESDPTAPGRSPFEFIAMHHVPGKAADTSDETENSEG